MLCFRLLFIKINPLSKIETVPYRNTGCMQLTGYPHTCFQIIRIMRIRYVHIFFKLTDFYTVRLIKINNLIGDTERLNRFIHCIFLFPVDKNISTCPRNTENIFVVIQFKYKRFIGHPKP